MPAITSDEMKDLQARVTEGMDEFSAENPTIMEAMRVMNITMPDYVAAMDALRGSQITSVSAYAPLPVNLTLNA